MSHVALANADNFNGIGKKLPFNSRRFPAVCNHHHRYYLLPTLPLPLQQTTPSLQPTPSLQRRVNNLYCLHNYLHTNHPITDTTFTPTTPLPTPPSHQPPHNPHHLYLNQPHCQRHRRCRRSVFPPRREMPSFWNWKL